MPLSHQAVHDLCRNPSTPDTGVYTLDNGVLSIQACPDPWYTRGRTTNLSALTKLQAAPHTFKIELLAQPTGAAGDALATQWWGSLAEKVNGTVVLTIWVPEGSLAGIF